MPASDLLSTCRRRSMLALAGGAVLLAVSWGASAGGWPLNPQLQGALAGIGLGLLFAAALLWFSPDLTDTAPRHLSRRYQREVWPVITAYVLVMLGWKRLLGLVDATWLKVLVALFPALLVLGVMRAFVRYVRDSDEMQRRIELESGSIAGLTVSGVYLAAGFLQTAGLIDIPAKVAMIWVFPMLCMVYGIAKVVIGRRYQ
jgi:hypothetical protein